MTPINGSPETMVAFHGRVLDLATRVKSVKDDALELIGDLGVYAEGVEKTMPISEKRDQLLDMVGTLQMNLARIAQLEVEQPRIEVAH